jgi:hypothetical protein
VVTLYVFTGPHTRRQHRGPCTGCGKTITRSRTFEHTVNPFNKRPDGGVKTWDEVRADVNAEADAWVPRLRCKACDDADELARASANQLRSWIRADAHYRDYECAGKPSRRALANTRLAEYAARLADLDPTLGDVTAMSRGGVHRCYHEFPDGSRCIYGTRHGNWHLSPHGEWATITDQVGVMA